MLIRRHRDFRFLWLAQLVSQLGDKVYALTVSWWVLELTATPQQPGGDPSQVGFLLAAGALAATLFGPWLGSLADRFPRRRLMMIADWGRAGLCAFLAYLASSGQGTMPTLYIVVFLLSVFDLLFNPSTHAILGSLVGDDEMQEALSLQQLTRDTCNVLGAALGGALIATVGVRLGLGLNALSFAVSALLILAIRRRETAHARDDAAGGGLGFLRGQPTLLGLLLVFSVANLFLVPIFVLIPAVSKIVLQGTALTLGLMEAALALGSIATTLVVLKLSFGKRWPSLCGAIVTSGLALVALAFSLKLPTVMALLAVLGGCLAVVNVQFVCMLQQLTPDHLKGRVFSVMETMATASFPVSFLLAGLAAERMSLSTMMIVCGTGTALAGWLIPFVPRIREV